MALPDPLTILAKESKSIPHPSFPIEKNLTINDVIMAKNKFLELIKKQFMSVMSNKRPNIMTWPKDDKPIVLHNNVTDIDLIRYENDWSEVSELFERNFNNRECFFSVEIVGREKRYLKIYKSYY